MPTNEQAQPVTASPQQSAAISSQLPLIVYILYFTSYFIGITAPIGVLIAHVEVGEANTLARTHYRFQIRTFWIGLLYLLVGAISFFYVVGIIVLVWWFIWSVVRNVKGVVALNEGRPIENPESWLFG